VQSASAVGPGGSRVLQVQQPVFTGDKVNTGPIGEAQLRFRDETRLVVGPNSSLTIDRFVFAADRTAREVGINAVKGAFRFISGVSPHQAYSIRTPTATIGIRGTRFDLAVLPNEETNFVLFEGGARVCDLAGRCLNVSGPCAFVVARRGQPLQRVDSDKDREAREARLRALFPYVVSQASLQPDFRADVSACGIQPLQQPPSGFAGALGATAGLGGLILVFQAIQDAPLSP
jgi:hypothetical protein